MFVWKLKINICKYLKNRNTDEKLMVQLIMCQNEILKTYLSNIRFLHNR